MKEKIRLNLEIPLLIIGGLIVVMITILSFNSLMKTSEKSNEIKKLTDRINALEKKLNKVNLLQEKFVNEYDDNDLYNRLEGTVALKVNLLSDKIDKIQKDINLIDKKFKKNVVESKIYKEGKINKKREVENKKKINKNKVASVVKKKYIHIIKKGETFFSISKQYGISVTALMKMNNKKQGSLIYPGQKLWISAK